MIKKNNNKKANDQNHFKLLKVSKNQKFDPIQLKTQYSAKNKSKTSALQLRGFIFLNKYLK